MLILHSWRLAGKQELLHIFLDLAIVEHSGSLHILLDLIKVEHGGSLQWQARLEERSSAPNPKGAGRCVVLGPRRRCRAWLHVSGPYICICICIYRSYILHMYIYIHIYICSIYLYIYTHVYIYTLYTYVYKQMYLQIDRHTVDVGSEAAIFYIGRSFFMHPSIFFCKI